MATRVEKTPSGGIIYRAGQTREYPQLDLLTLLLDSPHTDATDATILHADAADPTNKQIRRSTLRTLVKRVAYLLRHTYGIGSKEGQEEETVLCIATGHWLLPALFYSSIAAGAIFSAANPGATPRELTSNLNLVGAKLLLCTEETKPTAKAAAEAAGLPLSRVLVLGDNGAKEDNRFTLTPLDTNTPVTIPKQELEWRRITSQPVLRDTTICILFSSGTTGVPKACRLSHENMVSEACLVLDPVREYNAEHGKAKGDYRTVAHLPAAHIAGIQGYFINPAYMGGTVYWMPRFDFPLFLKYCKQYRVTTFFSVPPIFLAIAKAPFVTDQFDTVEFAISGAAPMGRELQAAARAKLGKGKAQIGQTWGLSETTGSMTAVRRGDPNDETGSVAGLVSNGEARIVDEEGRDVDPGQEGEIWVRGPQVTRGYFGKGTEKVNREAFEDDIELGGDRWFKTGDVAVFKNGMFYIVDRKKELIKYKGAQVAPAELEALLVSHPKILDAAVIGVPGEGTEVPRAYVVPATKDLTESEIQEWVAKQVSNSKRLRGGVIFIEAIPKSPSGKILRKDLRELAKKENKTSKL